MPELDFSSVWIEQPSELPIRTGVVALKDDYPLALQSLHVRVQIIDSEIYHELTLGWRGVRRAGGIGVPYDDWRMTGAS